MYLLGPAPPRQEVVERARVEAGRRVGDHLRVVYLALRLARPAGRHRAPWRIALGLQDGPLSDELIAGRHRVADLKIGPYGALVPAVVRAVPQVVPVGRPARRRAQEEEARGSGRQEPATARRPEPCRVTLPEEVDELVRQRAVCVLDDLALAAFAVILRHAIDGCVEVVFL